MNKHTKLVVGVLITILVLLIAATVSFSMNISKQTSADNTAPSDVINPDGNQIVRCENGLYGMSDSNGSVIIDLEWAGLRFLGTDYLAAVNQDQYVGVLDMDGNIVAPFVYSEVHALTDNYYLAEFAESDQAVLYDRAFHAFDFSVWDTCKWADDQLTLSRKGHTFYYTISEESLLLEQADLSCGNCAVSWNDKSDAAAFSPLQWSYAADTFAHLLDMIQSQDFSLLSEVTDTEHENKVLSGAALKNGKILRNDSTVFLSLQQKSNEAPTLLWQMGKKVFRMRIVI